MLTNSFDVAQIFPFIWKYIIAVSKLNKIYKYAEWSSGCERNRFGVLPIQYPKIFKKMFAKNMLGVSNNADFRRGPSFNVHSSTSLGDWERGDMVNHYMW